MRKFYRRYYVDENVFDNINDENAAYWLGFLYADGCVRIRKNGSVGTVKLKLKLSDMNHLEKFRRFLKTNVPIKTGRDKVVVDHRTYDCDFCSMEVNRIYLASALIKQGCVQRKTFILEFPRHINKKLVRHFIRGVFDGDGCIHKNAQNKAHTFSIVGTKNLLIGIKDVLDKITIATKGSILKSGKIYSLYYYKNKSLLQIRDFLYKESSVCLERKKLIFSAIEELPQLVKWDEAKKFLFKHNLRTQDDWSAYRQKNNINFVPHNIKRYYKFPKNGLTLWEIINNS